MSGGFLCRELVHAVRHFIVGTNPPKEIGTVRFSLIQLHWCCEVVALLIWQVTTCW